MSRFALGCVALLAAGLAHADEVTYWTDAARKQSGKLTGTITSETASAVTIKAGFKDTLRSIPAADVIDVVYTLDQAAYKEAVRLERARQLAGALKSYEAVKTANVAIARHVQYKIAMLTAQLAKEEKTLGQSAVERLARFHKDHPQSWQARPCLETLAALHIDRKEPDQAVPALDALGRLPAISATARWSYQLAAVQALIQAKEHAAAGQRLMALLKDASDEQRFEVRLLLAVCRAHTHFTQAVRDLEELIDLTMDARRLALAHNTLGDCYQLNSQPKEALYHYLHVDLLYPDDRAELVRAADQIAKLFRQLKRPERAKEYADKVAKLKG